MILVGKTLLNQNMICFQIAYMIHSLGQEFLTKTVFKLKQIRQVTHQEEENSVCRCFIKLLYDQRLPRIQ